MLIASRNGIIGNGLPYDREVEYLESTGTQLIDTMIYHNTSNTVKFKIRLPGLTNAWASSYSAYKDEDSATTRIIRNGINRSSILVYHGNKAGGGGALINRDSVIGDNTIQVYEGYTQPNLCAIKYINSEVYYNISLNSPLVSILPATMKLFSSQFPGSRIYYFSIDNQCDFIPVRKGKVGYMYDKVSKRLFGNQGTGSFIIGPDKTS